MLLPFSGMGRVQQSEIFSKRCLIQTSNKIDTPLNELPLKVIGPALFLDMNDKCTRAYEEAITRKAKQ